MSTNENLTKWDGMWKDGQTNWHLTGLNPALQKFGDKFFPTDPETKILFPLCGKTDDMTLLAPKYKVAGIEGIKQAIEEYATINNTKLVQKDNSDIQQLEKFGVELVDAENKPTVDLYFGDFFGIDPSESPKYPKFDRVFDRGSYVAIQPNMRTKYVAIIDSLLASGGVWMIQCLSYDTSLYPGPPHSLSYDQIVADLATIPTSEFNVEILSKVDAAEANSPLKLLQKNGGVLPTFDDWVILITKK